MEPLVFTFTERLDETHRLASSGKPLPVVTIQYQDRQLGDPLDDNAYEPDGYRYHDIFHMGVYAATGGRSPVMQLFLNNKTDTNPEHWQLRLEEALSILSFNEAKRLNFYQTKKPTGYLVNLLESMSQGSHTALSSTQWRKTLKNIYGVFVQLYENRGGTVIVEPEHKTIHYIAPVGA